MICVLKQTWYVEVLYYHGLLKLRFIEHLPLQTGFVLPNIGDNDPIFAKILGDTFG